MNVSPKLTEDLRQEVKRIIMDHTKLIDEHTCLLVSDGKMSAILKSKGYNVSTSYVQRMRKSLKIGTFTGEITDSDLRFIGTIIIEFAQEKDGVYYLTVTDKEMCGVLNERGFLVNPIFVQRLRNKMEIHPRGVSKKYTESEMYEIQTVIKEFTQENNNSWKLTVSDSEMCDVLNERGYDVNVKYVERTRRSLGIEPLGERGAKPGASRPSASSSARDAERADLINLHNAAVYQLSYRTTLAGALRGQTGIDVSDKYGQHTIDFDEAVARKHNFLNSQKQKVSSIPNYFISSEIELESEIESVFTDEIAGKTGYYGRVNKTGRTQNVHNSRVLSSL